MKKPGLHHWDVGCALVYCVPATALEWLCGQAGMVASVPGVTGAVGKKVAGWCAALCRASQFLAWLLGDGAGSQTKGGRVPCPVPPHREKLPGSSWHRSRKKGEGIWEDRKEKKDQRLKTEQKNPPYLNSEGCITCYPCWRKHPWRNFSLLQCNVGFIIKDFLNVHLQQLKEKFSMCEL